MGDGAAAAALDPAEIGRIFREESGRSVAALIGVFGDIDLAEDAAQPGRLDHHDRPQPGRPGQAHDQGGQDPLPRARRARVARPLRPVLAVLYLVYNAGLATHPGRTLR